MPPEPLEKRIDPADPNGMTVRQKAPRGPLASLGGWCYDRRRWVVGAWIVVLLGSLVFGAVVIRGSFKDRLGQGSGDSAVAEKLLTNRFPAAAGASVNIVVRADGAVDKPPFQNRISEMLASVSGLPHVVAVQSPFAARAAAQISADRRTALAPVQFDQFTADLSTPTITRVVDTARATAGDGLQVELDGAPVEKITAVNIGNSAYIAVIAALVVLLLAFGSVVAMGLPIATALAGIGVGMGVIDLFSNGMEVPSFGPELAGMIGLGVGIDYALFVVTRYRSALHRGATPREAITESMATSGRAVLFAGTTVVISLFGMMLLDQSFIYGLALASVTTVLFVVVAALTFLPALTGFVGGKIDRFHVPGLLHHGAEDSRKSWWYKWSRVIQHHPWLTGGSALIVLLLFAVPLLSIRFGFEDEGTLPPSTTPRRAYDLISDGFGPGTNGPLALAIEVGRASKDDVQNLAKQLRSVSDVRHVTDPVFNQADDVAVVEVVPDSSPQSQRTEDLVRHLRSYVLPHSTSASGMKVHVGGIAAASIDISEKFSERLWWVIGSVLAVSFLLLMVVFRSVLVPLKAAVMNLLSVGAAYGAIVAVFQWGWFGSILGIGVTAPIDPWIPLMLFTILFGLSMDYEVFLLSRIREEWELHGDNSAAVADGLAATGRVITAAAAIMVAVFASFIFGDVRILKVFGLGLAFSIFVDATLVRCVLVPATMELLGNANWWLPGWLKRLLPKVQVEEA